MTDKATDPSGAGPGPHCLELLQAQIAQASLDASLWHRASRLLERSHRLVEAIAAALTAVRLEPGSLDYRLALAGALHRAADFARAISQYEIAAALAPADARVLFGLAAALVSAGLVEEGARVCRALLEAEPSNADARSLLQFALSRHAPEQRTENLAMAQQLFNEGARLEAAGQASQALAAFMRSAQLLPGVAPSHYRIGCLLQDAGHAEDALSHYALAVRLQPELFGAAHNAGKVAAGFGLIEPAQRFLTQAHRLRPQDGIAMRLELLTPAIHDSPEAIAAARLRFEQGLDRILEAPPRIDDPLNKADLPTFYLAYHGLCNRHLHSKLARAFALAAPTLGWQAPHCIRASRRPGRIRVGFISRFMRAHSIGKVARGLIAELSRDRFEVYVLNIPPFVADDTALWMQARADHWLVLADTLPAARAEIGALELDILFYQDIGMEPFSYLLAFARLAKVQCVSFGHPDTTGTPTIDYYVSSDLYEPPGGAEHYSERLVELKGLPTLAYYFRPPVSQVLPSRAELGLPAGAHLYVCPQTLFKLHPDVDDLLRRILERDGAGRILLFSGECAQWSVMLQRRFGRVMPDVADRIHFIPRQPYARFLQFLAAADVMLDTPHFNGMTTSLEAFAVGTPVITLPGALQRGRVTQAMYRVMGIDGAVAASAEAYAEVAVELAVNLERRQALRELIAERNHLLFEDRRAVAEFERFFIEAHLESQQARAG